jgi:16S rRNA G527 N7-methylase RsmG
MVESVAKRWQRFLQNVVSIMDPDPLEDIHSRVRRLEQAVREAAVARGAGSASSVRTAE